MASGLVPVAMGLFGISEVLLNVEQSMDASVLKTDIKNLFPTWKDWADSIWPIMRGTSWGSSWAFFPGAGR